MIQDNFLGPVTRKYSLPISPWGSTRSLGPYYSFSPWIKHLRAGQRLGSHQGPTGIKSLDFRVCRRRLLHMIAPTKRFTCCVPSCCYITYNCSHQTFDLLRAIFLLHYIWLLPPNVWLVACHLGCPSQMYHTIWWVHYARMAAVLHGHVWLSKKKENICIGTELKCFSIMFGERGVVMRSSRCSDLCPT